MRCEYNPGNQVSGIYNIDGFSDEYQGLAADGNYFLFLIFGL